MHSRKSLLFDSNNIYIKRDIDPNFDVTMGSYNAVEICELVGLYILYFLGEKCRKDKIGLHRDDGFGVFWEYTHITSRMNKKGVHFNI